MLPLDVLLPLRMAVVTLRFTEQSAPRFFHQPALAAFLRCFAGGAENFERLIRIDTAESGRVDYAAGDCYRFTLIALAGGENLLQTILAGLAGLPAGAQRAGSKLPFRNNLQLISIHDAFTEQPAQRLEALTPYGAEQLNREAAAWGDAKTLRWEFLSPARLVKPPELRKDARGEARFCRDSRDVTAELLLARVYDALADLLRKNGVTPAPRPAPPVLRTVESHLFWINTDYTDADGQDHPMGGVTGHMAFETDQTIPPEWRAVLLLGQYTGIGQRPAFGFGRYRLTRELTPLYRRPPAAHSLLMHAMQEENRLSALQHIRSNLEETAAVDDAQAALEDDTLLPCLEALARRLLEGRYQAPALIGVLAAKNDGGVRALAIPPLADRILQRAVTQTLTPGLEHFQYPRSFGFRPGRSRLQARYAIQAAWREGYRWVYESDIADFFDSVDWQRLESRLRALFDSDPVVDRVMQWMRPAVEFEGQLIKRQGGLPQGSPLSPLMANLMLDDFDNDMESQGFRLVRFADDFVVLCKSPEQAQQAHQTALASLAEHGLDLKAVKTRITSMDRGFRYLGYLFVGDMALDVGKEETASVPAIPHPQSWLAHIGARPPQALTQKLGRAPAVESKAPVLSVGEATEGQRQLLCVTGEHCALSTHDGRLCVKREEAVLVETPWNNLLSVVLFGRHTLTTPAMDAALRHGVPIHMAGAMGQYRGVLWQGQPAEPGHQLWLRQSARFSDADACLNLARSVVEARMVHMRETLRQRGCLEAAHRLEALLEGLPSAEALDSLNGMEGAATREYFQGLATLLSAEWGFSGRNRQPPRDPFNALLSYGFTLLYGYTETLLIADGLLPWLGFYHQPHGRHATLASDLLEPFRHLVERTALTLLQRRQLTPKDFVSREDGACYIDGEARRNYLAHLIGRLNAPLKAYQEADAKTPLDHLHAQNLSLIQWLNTEGPFVPWRTR